MVAQTTNRFATEPERRSLEQRRVLTFRRISDGPRLASSWMRAWLRTDRIEGLSTYGKLSARLLISQIFLLSGVMKIIDPSATAAHMEGRGMFWVPFFLIAAIAVELTGGLSVLLGYKTRVGALLLFLFLIPVTLTFHNFWTYAPEQQQAQVINFMHNLTLMGGLLLLMAAGPGRISIDRKREQSPHARSGF